MPWGVAAAAIGAAGSIYSSKQQAKAAKEAAQLSSQQQTTTNTPWEGIQPYLTDLYQRAQSQANQGAYAGPYIGAQSQYTQQAIDALAHPDKNSLVNQASNQLGKTISGQYLDVGSNPYLQGAVQQALDQTQRQVSGQFSGDNFGSSAHQQWLTNSLAQTALPYYSQAYQQERQNQLNALQQAPGLQSYNLNNLLQAGNIADTRAQNEVNAGIAQWNAGWQPLQNYAEIVQGYGTPNNSQTTGTGQVQTPSYSNPISAGVGGALAGWQLGSQIGNAVNNPNPVYGAPSGSWVNQTPTSTWTGFPW